MWAVPRASVRTQTRPGRWLPPSPMPATFAQRIDLAAASFPNERTAATYLADNWLPLLESGQLEVVDGPQLLAQGVYTQIAPGHTAAQQVVWVEDGGESLLFLSDAANWAAHMERLAWVPAYDIDPMTAIESKRALRDEALRRETLLVFQHDAQVVTGRLAAGGAAHRCSPKSRAMRGWMTSRAKQKTSTQRRKDAKERKETQQQEKALLLAVAFLCVPLRLCASASRSFVYPRPRSSMILGSIASAAVRPAAISSWWRPRSVKEMWPIAGVMMQSYAVSSSCVMRMSA